MTERLKAVTVQLLAAGGLAGFTIDQVAAAAAAGKAGVYRRWPDSTSLVAEALSEVCFIPVAGSCGTFRGDLAALTAVLTCPLAEPEAALGSVISGGLHQPQLRRAVSDSLDRPLAAAVTNIAAAAAGRGERAGTSSTPLAVHLLHGLFLRRYVTGEPISIGQQQAVVTLVAGLLLDQDSAADR